jgi:hypothetical protein
LASVPPSPQVNGWSFVATPSPAPGEDHEPFITWGNIEGTPLLLSEPTDTPIVVRDSEEPTFKVPELTKRELIALKLADQVQFKRKKKITQQVRPSSRCLLRIEYLNFVLSCVFSDKDFDIHSLTHSLTLTLLYSSG